MFFGTSFSQCAADWIWFKSVILCHHGLLTDHMTYTGYFNKVSNRPRFPPLLMLNNTFVLVLRRERPRFKYP